MTATLARFGFTKLVVVDLEAAASFYKAVFGVEEQHRVHSAIGGRAIEEIICAADGPAAATLVLLRFTDQSTPSSSELILGFITDDIDALFGRALAAGGAVVQAVEVQAEHGVKVGFVTDPEGHLIEVVEMLAGH